MKMNMEKTEYGNIPEYMRRGIDNYIYHGIIPGSFLRAVLENDLATAVASADLTNRHLLCDYVHFFLYHAPANCWGSKEIVNAYVDEKARRPL